MCTHPDLHHNLVFYEHSDTTAEAHVAITEHSSLAQGPRSLKLQNAAAMAAYRKQTAHEDIRGPHSIHNSREH